MFIFDTLPTPSCHASTVAEVAPGRLVAAWFGGTAEGKPDVRIWLARHDGQSWSAPEVVADGQGVPCWNPVLFPGPKGSCSLWYKVGPSPMTWTGYVRQSNDQGRTWCPAEQLPAGFFGPVRAKPITLADGSLLAPTSVESYQAWTAYVDRSTDGGKTWRRSTPIAVPGKPFGLIQPTLIETAPGHVMALCRSRGIGFICRADSTDGGVTWSPAQPTTLANPNSGIDAVRTTTGDIYLIYNPTKLRRTPLNLDRSRDGGQTWETVQVLEEDAGEFSYPAIILTSDGSLQMVYTWNRQKIRHVVVRLK